MSDPGNTKDHVEDEEFFLAPPPPSLEGGFTLDYANIAPVGYEASEGFQEEEMRRVLARISKLSEENVRILAADLYIAGMTLANTNGPDISGFMAESEEESLLNAALRENQSIRASLEDASAKSDRLRAVIVNLGERLARGVANCAGDIDDLLNAEDRGPRPPLPPGNQYSVDGKFPPARRAPHSKQG